MFQSAFLPFMLVSFLTLTGYLQGQNLTADGYRGIWFSHSEKYEYGYKYSGGLGTYAPHHTPTAIYSPEADKTFFVYGGTTSSGERHLQIMVSYFDHKSKKVPKPVVVYDKMGVSEPHDNASIMIDQDGYIWVFVSGRLRTRPGLIFKSLLPYSIDSFEQAVKWEMTFPQPWNLNNNHILFFIRIKDGPELYIATSIDGRNWDNIHKLACLGGHFHVSGLYGNRLTVVFNYHPQGNLNGRTNLYLIQTDDMGKSWRTVDNREIEVPIGEIHNEALIRDFQKEDKLVYINDLSFDSEGNPVILAIISRSYKPGPEGDPREWMVISWKDGKWNFSKVCESSHNYDGGTVIVKGDEWRVIGPTEPGPVKYGTGGEIALWVSRDEGLTWIKEKDITTASLKNNSYVRHPVNADKRFYAYWVDGDASQLSASQIYFTNRKFNKVWVLPYTMKKNLQKPERIR